MSTLLKGHRKSHVVVVLIVCIVCFGCESVQGARGRGVSSSANELKDPHNTHSPHPPRAPARINDDADTPSNGVPHSDFIREDGPASRSKTGSMGTDGDKSTANEATDEAMKLVKDYKFEESLKLFEKACRLDPHNADRWNNLAVTQVYVGNIKKAKVVFKQALKVDPNHADAKKNLGAIERDFPEKDSPTSKKVHARAPIPTVTLATLSEADKRKPFIVKNVGATWTAVSGGDKSWQPEVLMENFADEYVFNFPRNRLERGSSPEVVMLGEALEGLLGVSEASVDAAGFSDSEDGVWRGQEAQYIFWNPTSDVWSDVVKDLGRIPRPVYDHVGGLPIDWVSSCLEDENQNAFILASNLRTVTIGTEGAGMYNHQDSLPMASITVQIVGAKRWHLCGPDQSQFMMAGADALRADYEKYPLLRQAQCFEGVVEEGDLLYYPVDWWHQTENEELSVAYAMKIVQDSTFIRLGSKITKHCETGPVKDPLGIAEPIPEFDSAVCAEVSKCLDWWDDALGFSVL